MVAGEPGTGDPPLVRHAVRLVGDLVGELVGEFRGRRGGGAGHGPTAAADGRIRLSDAERDTAAEVLRDAYAEGRLDLGELEDRLTLVHTARVRAELPPVLADLPGATAVPGSGGAAPEVLTAVLRDVRRTGTWELPPRLRVLVRGGTALLDLRGARVRSEVVEIDVSVTGGRVLVIVPDGVPVEVRDGLTLLGRRSDTTGRRIVGLRGSGPAADAVSRIVVGGEVVAGRLVVRAATWRERRQGG